MGLVDLNIMKDFEDQQLNDDFKLLQNSAEYLKTIIDNTLDFGFIDYENFELDMSFNFY